MIRQILRKAQTIMLVILKIAALIICIPTILLIIVIDNIEDDTL